MRVLNSICFYLILAHWKINRRPSCPSQSELGLMKLTALIFHRYGWSKSRSKTHYIIRKPSVSICFDREKKYITLVTAAPSAPAARTLARNQHQLSSSLSTTSFCPAAVQLTATPAVASYIFSFLVLFILFSLL